MTKCKKLLMNVRDALERRWKALLLILLLLQAAFSVVCLIAYGGNIVSNDTPDYTVPALSFIGTGKFIDQSGDPMLFRTPGAPFILAVIYFFGGSNTAVSVVQLLLALSASALIFMTIKMITKTNWAGIVGVIFYTFDYLHYYYCVNIGADNFFTYMLVAAAFFLAKWMTGGKKWRWFFLAALMVQFAVLTKPTLLYYVLLLPVLLVILVIARKINWRALAVYLAVFAVCFCGWCARNYCYSGYFMVSNVRYTQFYNYDGPDLMAQIENIPIPEAEDRFSQMLEEEFGDTSGMSVMQLDECKKVVGNGYVFSHLGEYLKMNVKGLFLLMLGPGTSPLRDVISSGAVLGIFYVFNSGILVVLYLIYAVSFLRRLKKVTGYEWLLFLTSCYLIAATSSLGYSRFRLAFYPLVVIGAMLSLARTTAPKQNGIAAPENGAP
jgi:4-amino-4-deoxy-L-arabinose transferase-like glycosyltransferase